MSNSLTVAMIDSILALHKRRWSQRRIALELGIDRETVRRYLKQAESPPKPANAPIGSESIADAPKPANAPIGSEGVADGARPVDAPTPAGNSRAGGRSSDCEPWREVIRAKCDLALSAQRIFQDLVTEHGFTGSYFSVRRFIRRLAPQRALPFRRLECDPGDEAQVDFGTGAPVITAERRRRKTYVFRIVLSYSRKAYSEAVYHQTTEEFLRCLENAFRHFGGVPLRLVLDNLKAAVTRADWFDPDLNPKVRSFAAHYGLVLWPTRPYTPRHKGKVERGIDYVQNNALKGRRFASLEEQNRFLQEWERTVADTRLHGTTRRQVAQVFAVERPTLGALPVDGFPCFHEARRKVHRDGHVAIGQAYYSVPPEYLAREVWVRWDARMVRVFNDQMEQIALHVRREPGRFSTQQEHIAAEKVSSVERGAAWLLGRVRRLGPHSTVWAEAMIAARGVEGVRVLQGLLSLADRQPIVAIERACEIAASYGAYHLRTVRSLIERNAPKQQTLPFLEEHPMIRPLSDYGQFVHDVFQHQETSQ